MISETDFIEKVEAHQILYNCSRKGKCNRAENQRTKELWTQIAQECGFKNGTAAQKIWQQLKSDYLEYLRRGGDFPYAAKMQFVQMWLLQSTNDLPDGHSDSELDEAELECILSADDGESAPEKAPAAKRGHMELAECTNRSEASSKHVADSADRRKPETNAVSAVETDNASGNFSNLSSLELIFLGYAKELQKMPLPLQLQTKRKIADIMDEAAMQLYTQK